MILAAWYHIILAVIFAGIATFLMLIVLLQRGKGVGLAGAFGGAGGQTVFGSKTGDVLTWATVVVAGVFMLSAVLLNYVFVPQRAGLNVPTISAPGGASASETLPMEPLESDGPAGQPADAAPAATGTPTPAAGAPAAGAEQPAPATTPEAAPPSGDATPPEGEGTPGEGAAEPAPPASESTP